MRRVRGSATVEMAYIMPVVFLVFQVLLYILFYLHDKNIIYGAGYETMVVSSQKSGWENDIETQMERFLRERIEGKLIIFSESAVEGKVLCKKGFITVQVKAEKNRMKIHTEQKMKVVEQETYIRNVRRLHGNQIQKRF